MLRSNRTMQQDRPYAVLHPRTTLTSPALRRNFREVKIVLKFNTRAGRGKALTSGECGHVGLAVHCPRGRTRLPNAPR